MPPCYTTVTWLAPAFDKDDAVAALNGVVEHYPFFLGRLFRDARGRWRIEGPLRDVVSVDEVAEREPFGLSQLLRLRLPPGRRTTW